MESDLYNLDDLTAMSTLAAETNNNTNNTNTKKNESSQQEANAYYNDNPAKLKQEIEKKQKLVSNTLQNRFEKMQAEEIKLKQIKKTLSLLDSDTSKEIHVLRGKIEYTQSQLVSAETNFKIKQKELVELNESVNELREKKQLLTEHLSVIIYESEKKKQEKLKELMLALDLGDVTNEEAEKAWKGIHCVFLFSSELIPYSYVCNFFLKISYLVIHLLYIPVQLNLY